MRIAKFIPDKGNKFKPDGHRFVHREKPKIRSKEFGTFDMESYGLGGAYADGTTYTPVSGSERHRDVNSLWARLIDPPRQSRQAWTWYAHAGARYDFTYISSLIVDYAFTHNLVVETVQQGSKIIGLKVPTPGGLVLLYDSFPLLQSSLEAAGKAFSDGSGKAAHCVFHDFSKGGEYSPDCAQCVSYMHQDAVALYNVLVGVKRTVNEVFGVDPSLTTGGLAIRAWKTTIPVGHTYYRQSDSKEDFLRRVGCGSLTYPGYTSDILRDWITIDRTAAFAACMLDGGYPVSPGIWVSEYVPGHLGMYHCRAMAPPDCNFPVLPAYTAQGRKFATGRFYCYITSEQFTLAIGLGYVLEVIRGLIFERVENVFAGIIGMCQSLEVPEDGSPCDPGVKIMVKHIRNSLNGKFNIRPVMERIYIGDPPIGAKGWIDPSTGNGLPGYILDEIVDAPYANPAWYALTVTRQQICMIEMLLRLGVEERGKVDTDSITIPVAALKKLPVKLEPGYGNWKIEHEWEWLQSLGVKNYHGVEIGGKRINFCKGIPRSVMAMSANQQVLAGQGVKQSLSFQSVRTLTDMFKYGGDIPGIVRSRSISMPQTATGWNWNPDTLAFSPIHLEEW